MTQLVVHRKKGEGVWLSFQGKEVRVVVVSAEDGNARLAIQADIEVKVDRDEIREKKKFRSAEK